MPVFLCRSTKSCKLTISVLGTSSGTTTEHRFNDLDFQGKNPRQIPSVLAQPCFSNCAFQIIRVRVGIPATCYRTENAQIPKSAGESAGKSAEKKGTAGGTAGSSAVLCFSKEAGLPALLPAMPPAVPFFPALFPALSPALLGIWAFSVL